MRPRHWQMLRELTCKQFDETAENFNLRTLNELHLNEVGFRFASRVSELRLC